MTFVTFQDRQEIKVILSSPISVPEARRNDAPLIINRLNLRLGVDNLELTEEGKVYYRWSFGVEGSVASPAQIRNMLMSGMRAFDEI